MIQVAKDCQIYIFNYLTKNSKSVLLWHKKEGKAVIFILAKV
jgi:hypothetical protein